MIDIAHPVYFWIGLLLFLGCIALMFFVVDRLRRQRGAIPILFSTHPQELQKLGDFVAFLPDPQRRLVRSIALLGFFFLAAGFYFGLKGL